MWEPALLSHRLSQFFIDHPPTLVLGVAGKATYDTGLGLMLDWS